MLALYSKSLGQSRLQQGVTLDLVLMMKRPPVQKGKNFHESSGFRLALMTGVLNARPPKESWRFPLGKQLLVKAIALWRVLDEGDGLLGRTGRWTM